MCAGGWCGGCAWVCVCVCVGVCVGVCACGVGCVWACVHGCGHAVGNSSNAWCVLCVLMFNLAAELNATSPMKMHNASKIAE